eukprot:PhM_4_TR16186/c0_g1_i1/m.92064
MLHIVIPLNRLRQPTPAQHLHERHPLWLLQTFQVNDSAEVSEGAVALMHELKVHLDDLRRHFDRQNLKHSGRPVHLTRYRLRVRGEHLAVVAVRLADVGQQREHALQGTDVDAELVRGLGVDPSQPVDRTEVLRQQRLGRLCANQTQQGRVEDLRRCFDTLEERPADEADVAALINKVGRRNVLRPVRLLELVERGLHASLERRYEVCHTVRCHEREGLDDIIERQLAAVLLVQSGHNFVREEGDRAAAELRCVHNKANVAEPLRVLNVLWYAVVETCREVVQAALPHDSHLQQRDPAGYNGDVLHGLLNESEDIGGTC